MTYIGVDVGAKGALAIISEKNELFVEDFNKKRYIEILSSLDKSNTLIAIEKVHSMPKQGVKSMFTFGEKFGWIQGVLDAYGLRYVLIEPRKWMHAIGVVGSGKTAIKNRVVSLRNDVAEKIYGTRGGLKDGRCDAIGIAIACSKIKEIK